MPKYRNRIKAFRTVNARDIRENEQNPRRHNAAQADALKGLLEDVGLVDVLKVVETEDGELILVDGHLRRDLVGSGTVQVAVLDLDERETKQVLAHFDQVGNMADVDAQAMDALLADIASMETPSIDDTQVGAVLDAIADTPEPEQRKAADAQAIADSVNRKLQSLAQSDPETFTGAHAVIVPTDSGKELLVIADPDLSDIIAELRMRHEAGETHPLDALFACIWSKP